jgi:hypothetical protein
MNHTNDVAKGLLALTANSITFAVSMTDRVEVGLRITGLILSAAVSAAMLFSIVMSVRHKRKKYKNEK